MAALQTDYTTYQEVQRHLDRCRKVGIPITDLTSGDTFAAGPGLLMVAWEQATTNTGVGGWYITDRDTGTCTWDSAGAAQEGTLWCYYGAYSGGA